MEITLTINGQDKKFISPNPTFKVIRLGADLTVRAGRSEFLPDGDPTADFDEAVAFVCAYFGDQFTVEDFHNGYQAQDLLEFCMLVNEILGAIQVNPKRLEAKTSTEQKNSQKKKETK